MVLATSLSTSLPGPNPVPAHEFDRFLVVRPWIDPVVEAVGHEPRSRYVELFWLGVLGPSATWLLRRMVDGLDTFTEGYELDLVETAAALGLTFIPGRHGPFSRALQRCVMFGLASNTFSGLAVRRRIPPLTARHLDRLPQHLREAHQQWHAPLGAVSAADRARALAIACALAQTGDAPAEIERRLTLVGTDPAMAAEIAWPTWPTEHPQGAA